MQLFTENVAENIIGKLTSDTKLNDEKILSLIAEERTRLLGTGIKVIIFLFTTITIIAVTVLGAVEGEMSFFGIKIEDPDLFAFISFIVGNVLYVICTGLFMKVFIMEFIVLNIVTNTEFEDDPRIYAFIRSFHANVISFLLMFGFFEDKPKIMSSFFKFINFYAKYYVLIAYGVYYYSVLGYFIYTEIADETIIGYIFSTTLIVVNIMSMLTSYAIFYPLRR